MANHHSRADGSDPVTINVDAKSLFIALCLIGGFLLVEALAGIYGRSLTLLADAGHMLTDVASLAMSTWAIHIAKKPAHGRWTYGLKRVEVLSAAINGVSLVAIALLIGVEAIQRLVTPQHVNGELMLVVALVGATVNIVATFFIARANRTSLNIRGAYLHVLTDLYAFIGTAIAGSIIVLTGWKRADPVASLFVVVLMVTTAWGLLRDSGRILLQASPEDLDLRDVRSHLLSADHVIDIHDLHAWTVTSGLTTLSAHVVVEDICFHSGHTPQILDALQARLTAHFAIEHATFQLEPASHSGHEDGLHS